jgi:hypothetical protein
MRRLIVSHLVAMAAGFLLVTALADECHAQSTTVQTSVGLSTRRITGLGINATRTTSWIAINNSRSIAWDVDYVFSAATAVNMTCQTCQTVTAGACNAGDGPFDMHVIVSTSAAGLVTTAPATWTYAAGANKSWRWTVSNMYAPFVSLLIHWHRRGGWRHRNR